MPNSASRMQRKAAGMWRRDHIPDDLYERRRREDNLSAAESRAARQARRERSEERRERSVERIRERSSERRERSHERRARTRENSWDRREGSNERYRREDRRERSNERYRSNERFRGDYSKIEHVESRKQSRDDDVARRRISELEKKLKERRENEDAPGVSEIV